MKHNHITFAGRRRRQPLAESPWIWALFLIGLAVAFGIGWWGVVNW